MLARQTRAKFRLGEPFGRRLPRKAGWWNRERRAASFPLHLQSQLYSAQDYSSGSINSGPRYVLGRAHPSQGEGRAQMVVEPKQELPFEIAQGEPGGAAERGVGLTMSVN